MQPFYKLLLLIILPFVGNGQNTLQQEWIKPVAGTHEYRGLQSLDYHGRQCIMGGYISNPDTTFGCVHCDSNGNAWLLVTDSDGNKIYSHCYGGSKEDDFESARYGKNGSIWAIGPFNSIDGDFPNSTGKIFGVVKFDSTFNPIWYHFYGSNAENDFGDFITTSDGGALILASTNYARGDIPYIYSNSPFNFAAYLCKLDSSGNIKWLKVLGGSGNQYAMKVKELVPDKYSVLIYTNSVDYMLAGLNFDSINCSPWLVEIDTGGNILSSRVAPHLGGFESRDFMLKHNGDILFGGETRPLNDSDFCYPGLGGSDFALITTDSGYRRQWCKIMGGSNDDYLYYISPINDSVVALFGKSASIDGDLSRCINLGGVVYHGWLALVNTKTEELTWQTSFCNSENVIPEGILYDSVTQSLYVLVFGGVDGDFASAAIAGTNYNTYLVKYGLITSGVNEVSKINSVLNLYPNPSSNTCTLKIDEPNQMSSAFVFDAIDRQVMSLFDNQHLSSFNFSCNALSSGLYFVRVTDNEGKVGVVKMVKE